MGLLKKSLLLVALYVAAWTLAYAAIMEGDFQYYFEYLKLAWSAPGELPALIQIYSVSVALVSFIVVIAAVRRKRRLANRERTGPRMHH